MIHTYQITGMTCSGCSSGIAEKLNGITGVVQASVNLEKGEAEIEMKNHISTAAFQNAIGPKYTIREKLSESLTVDQAPAPSEFRQLFPLFLILGYLTIAAILLNRNKFNVHGFMLDFMGLFYIVFAFFKLLDLKGFAVSFGMYDPLAKKVPVYAMVYPFIETALGLLLLLRFEIRFALLATIMMLGITTIGVTKVLVDKQSIQCACLGTALKLPMTKATFIENSLMIAMAILMLMTGF